MIMGSQSSAKVLQKFKLIDNFFFRVAILYDRLFMVM